MKKIFAKTLILLFIILLNSCAVVNSLLGLDDCDYNNCSKKRVDNCNYCIIHCNSQNIPEDFNSKIGKSIDKQLEDYKNSQKRN